MKLVYLGAEVPSNRTILEQMNVASMGVSVWGLIKRGLPKTKKYLLSNYFPDHVSIYVYPGLPTGRTFSADELEEFHAEYEEFIADNIDRITLFTEVTHPDVTPAFTDQQRRTVWSEVPEEKFGVVYNNGDLESLATRYLNVFLPGNLLEERSDLSAKLNTYSLRHGTVFHGIGSLKPDLMRNTPLSTIGSLAWLSPMMRGETIVWNANTLTRYPKRMKEQARSRYNAVYEKAKLNFHKIMADDAVEISKLAVWSYQQLEDWLNRTELVTVNEETPPTTNAETTPSDVAKRGDGMRKLEPRSPDEIRPLPVLGVELSRSLETNSDGIDVLRDVPLVRSTSTSLRVCNTCFIKDNCPAFKPDSSCAYNIPVELRTKDQLKSLINTMLEIQGQRTLFAKMTEDINGGYPDPNVGQEMDRFFKMLESVKKLDESKEVIRISAERQGASGVLSALFGDRAQVLNELPNGSVSEKGIDNLMKDINPDLS